MSRARPEQAGEAQAEAARYPTATVTLQGREITYALRESVRARQPRLWIAPAEGLVVTVPAGWTASQTERFLRQHQRWVLRWDARHARRWQTLPKRWPYGERLFYRGLVHGVQIRPGRVGAVEVAGGCRMIVSTRTPGIDGARRVLRRWLRAQATQTLAERVEAYGAMMGLRPRRLYVRSLRRAWGRCWANGSLSFSAALVMAPPEVLDYVVVHELAHLREPNHSPQFWNVVAAYAPDYPAHRAWLRTHGPLLAV
ncbi:MAG: M48 family metallopeptidase [Candidatus Omnitrophica bacterium]|nr:M48 family metallopeptidase [Candidatus Omnitrophota bacterium]